MSNGIAKNPNNFDVIRFILASAVIVAHSVPLTGNGISYTALFTKGQLDLGVFAVNLFFVISGYLIVASYLRINNLIKYLIYRILRILPGLILMLLVTIFIVGPIVNSQSISEYFTYIRSPTYLKSVILHIKVNIPGFDTKSPTAFHQVINGAIWTLPVEFSCYLLVAILGVSKCLNKYIVVLFCILNVYLYINFSAIFHHLLGDNPTKFGMPLEGVFRLCGYFFAGSVFYLYRQKIILSGKYALLSVVILLISCRLHALLDITMPIFGSYLLFYFAFHKKIKLYNFARFGDFSYGIYIYGFLIQQLIIMSFNGHMNNTLNYIISLPLAVLVGAISYYVIEKPCMNLKKYIP